jgi:hypothetical protein
LKMVTMNNISGIDLTGNIDFVLIGLTAGVSLSGATGYTAGGANPKGDRGDTVAGSAVLICFDLERNDGEDGSSGSVWA